MKNKTGRKLLVVDDDDGYRESLCVYLRFEDFEVDSAASVEDGIKYLDTSRYDLLLLDIRLRDHETFDISGGEVAKKAREISIPCIMITAYPSTEVSRIFLNSLRAESLARDILEKKDGPVAIMAAVQAILSSKGPLPRQLEEPILVIDKNLRLVKLRGKQVRLSQKQYDLLSCLAQKEGAVFSHREIFQFVYGETLLENEAKTDSRLERLVERVREKIRDDPNHPRFLRNETGRGYRLLLSGKEIPPESPG